MAAKAQPKGSAGGASPRRDSPRAAARQRRRSADGRRLPEGARAENTVVLGASAEDQATRLLLESGYRIVERNFRCRAGELDLIARHGPALVFVEVRSRADADHGHA